MITDQWDSFKNVFWTNWEKLDATNFSDFKKSLHETKNNEHAGKKGFSIKNFTRVFQMHLRFLFFSYLRLLIAFPDFMFQRIWLRSFQKAKQGHWTFGVLIQGPTENSTVVIQSLGLVFLSILRAHWSESELWSLIGFAMRSFLSKGFFFV